jgi:hypothetical protein
MFQHFFKNTPSAKEKTKLKRKKKKKKGGLGRDLSDYQRYVINYLPSLLTAGREREKHLNVQLSY